MRLTGRYLLSSSVAIALAAGFSVGLASQASAASTYWKVGTQVSHSRVFSGGNGRNMRCFGPQNDISDAVMCYRSDRNATYVQSKKASGYFKLGQHRQNGGGSIWRCQNNYKNSAGTGTWVECKWSTKPRAGACATARVGHGQNDWFKLSTVGDLICF